MSTSFHVRLCLAPLSAKIKHCHYEDSWNNVIDNAITHNNCEIDMVNNYVLYLATVSIKHKAADLIKARTFDLLDELREAELTENLNRHFR